MKIKVIEGWSKMSFEKKMNAVHADPQIKVLKVEYTSVVFAYVAFVEYEEV